MTLIRFDSLCALLRAVVLSLAVMLATPGHAQTDELQDVNQMLQIGRAHV